MVQEIKISFAEPQDALGLMEMIKLSWLDTYPNEEYGITRENIEERFKTVLTEEKLAKYIKSITNIEARTGHLIAKDGEKIVGACRVKKYDGYNQLRAIYLLPEYQRQGLGTRLWLEAQKLIDTTKKTIVHVATYNSKAINFYQKLGFVDNGKRFTEERHRMKSGAYIPEMEMELSAFES